MLSTLRRYYDLCSAEFVRWYRQWKRGGEMPFVKTGFVGTDAKAFVSLNRKEFEDYFKLAEDLNRHAHDLLEAIKPRIARSRNPVLVSTLYLRVLSSLASALRLMEAGLCVDGGTVTRSLLESAIVLRKCALDPPWIDRYMEQETLTKLTLTNVMLEIKAPKEMREKLQARKLELEKEIEEKKIKPISVADLAKDKVVAAKGIYDNVYRLLSNNSVHTSSRSLDAFLQGTKDGDIEAIVYGNNTKMLPRLMSACCWGVWVSMDAVKTFFKVDMALDEEISDRLKALFIPDEGE